MNWLEYMRQGQGQGSQMHQGMPPQPQGGGGGQAMGLFQSLFKGGGTAGLSDAMVGPGMAAMEGAGAEASAGLWSQIIKYIMSML